MNYPYFLRLMQKYLVPIADVISYGLLPTEIHLFIYVKTEDELDKSTFTYATVSVPKSYDVSRQLSHMLNAFTQGMNKKYHNSGNFLCKRFNRKIIKSTAALRYTTVRIHKMVPSNTATHPTWNSYRRSIETNWRIVKKHLIPDSKKHFTNWHSPAQTLYL
ncbi:MAG: hypothetical protein EOO04_30580 [Chitinophagaceae bacterium]|nr:MAG: hypothetical protein EOO04_30580 [Chitinophagaceae bacterium]